MKESVAVIIPTYNEEKYIETCVDSVRRQTFPFENMDIMIVDGGSDDRTCEIVKEMSLTWKNIRLINNPQKIQSVAFNIGVANSTAPVIVRLDAHAEYHEKYIELCLKHLTDNPQVGDVGGVWDIKTRGIGIVADANVVLNQSRFGIGGASFRIGAQAGYVDTVPFGAFPRRVVDEIGGMREDMPRAEDNEYVSRIKKAGYKIYLDPEIICTYYARDTFMGSVKQMYANGLSIGHLFYVDKVAIGLRHFVPFAFVTSLLLTAVGTIMWLPFAYLLALIIGSYVVVDLMATFFECKKHGWRYVIVLPLLFLSIHISYGWGTLVGLFKYIGRGN